MYKKIVLFAILIISFLSLATRAMASTSPLKITICHATDSNTNPYVQETPDTENDGSLSGGHFNHTGPVWNLTLKASHIQWGDIIPPYSDPAANFIYSGMNWTTAGQIIYANGCNVATSTPTPTPHPCIDLCHTPTPTPTPTPRPCDDDEEFCFTPTPRPTNTPTPTPISTPVGSATPSPTPTVTPSPTPISCPADQHVDLSGTKCLSWELGGAPTPPPAGGSGGRVLGTSTTNDPGQVLGASTLGSTGVAEDMLAISAILLGAVITPVSFYAFKKQI